MPDRLINLDVVPGPLVPTYGTTRLECTMTAGGSGQLFALRPRGAEGQDVPWPDDAGAQWTASAGGIATVEPLASGRAAVVRPLAPGSALITITYATLTSYIGITVVATPLDHVDVEPS